MKKRTRNSLVAAGIALVLAVTAFVLWFAGVFSLSSTVFYRDYGIGIPKGYGIYGIDVSRYQGEVHWEGVKNMNIDGVKVNFAFMKATEGLTHRDLFFERNWIQAGRCGMLRGAYHFFHPSLDPEKQAAFFASVSGVAQGDMPPVADVEVTQDLPVNELRKNLKRFLTALELRCKCKPIIYTYADFYLKNLDTFFNDYPFWVAHYNDDNVPKTERKWSFWQFSDRATVNGIRHKVDFNVFSGDSLELEQLRLK